MKLAKGKTKKENDKEKDKEKEGDKAKNKDKYKEKEKKDKGKEKLFKKEKTRKEIDKEDVHYKGERKRADTMDESKLRAIASSASNSVDSTPSPPTKASLSSSPPRWNIFRRKKIISS